MNLKSFHRRMKVIGANVEANTDKLVKQVAVQVDAAVVLATPVDTGRARSNWVVELNEPANNIREPMPPQAVLAAAQATINAYNNGDEIHITNNLPYIERLNEGWSAQAPAGFVEQAVKVGANAVRRARVVVG